jgi:hypothetical protein
MPNPIVTITHEPEFPGRLVWELRQHDGHVMTGLEPDLLAAVRAVLERLESADG